MNHKICFDQLPFIPDIPRGIRRLAKDQRDDWFPDPLLFQDLTESVEDVQAHLNAFINLYSPAESETFNIPKPGFTLRYGMQDSFYERILYQVIADFLIDHFDPILSERVFSYRYDPNNKDYLFRNPIEGWLYYIKTVRTQFEETDCVLLNADVFNYYESISIPILCDNLRSYSPRSPKSVRKTIDFLEHLLTEWSPFGVFGIPQNRDASSFLGNMYLHSVDQIMIQRGYNYFRYMDDVMIACADEYEARRALHDLVELLRNFHLNVNAKKTEIVHCEDNRFDEILPSSNPILEQINSLLGSPNPILHQRAVPILHRHLFHVLEGDEFNERDFKFCLQRIFNASRTGLEHDWTEITDRVVPLLDRKPWLTSQISQLLRITALSETHISQIEQILRNNERNIYDWQAFHLWRVLGECNVVRDSLLELARDHSKLELSKSNSSTSSRIPLFASASLYLGKNGTLRDRYHISKRISSVTSSFAKRILTVSSQEATEFVAKKYVEPELSGLLLNRYRELRSRPTGPVYYVRPTPLDPDEILFDLPEIPS